MTELAADPAEWPWEAHRDAVLGAVRRQERHIGIGGDWAPVLLLDAGRSVVEVPVGALDVRAVGPWVQNIMRQLAERTGACWFARVQHVWAAKVASEEEARRAGVGAAASSPNREEMVIVLLGNRDRHEVWTARVYRPTKRSRPKLGPWELGTFSQDGYVFQGALAATGALRPTSA